MHDVIYQELCLGVTRAESRRQYLEIIDSLVERGAEGIVLGCTEVGMLVGEGDTQVPLFDTTAIHAVAAADRAIDQG